MYELCSYATNAVVALHRTRQRDRRIFKVIDQHSTLKTRQCSPGVFSDFSARTTATRWVFIIRTIIGSADRSDEDRVTLRYQRMPADRTRFVQASRGRLANLQPRLQRAGRMRPDRTESVFVESGFVN